MRSDQQQYQRTEVGTTTDEGAYDSNEEIADDPKPGALRQGCRVPDQGSRRAAFLLPLSCGGNRTGEWPKTRGQRCWVHKTANVLNKLPKSQQSKAKRALQEIWMAETKR